MIQHYLDLKKYELVQVDKMGCEKTGRLLIEIFSPDDSFNKLNKYCFYACVMCAEIITCS